MQLSLRANKGGACSFLAADKSLDYDRRAQQKGHPQGPRKALGVHVTIRWCFVVEDYDQSLAGIDEGRASSDDCVSPMIPKM